MIPEGLATIGTGRECGTKSLFCKGFIPGDYRQLSVRNKGT